MEVTFLLGIVAAIFLLVVFCAIYFAIYKQNINRVLRSQEKNQKPIPMAPPHRVVPVLLIVAVTGILVAGGIYWMDRNRITTVREIEEDMRRSSSVGIDWDIEIASSETMAAALTYNADKSEYRFAIYTNRGPLYGFQFRDGGHTTSIKYCVSVFRYEDTLAIISMNPLGIARIESHDGESYILDPNEPFALLIPDGGFDVYDKEGNRIDLEHEAWYEKITIPQ